MKRSRSGKRLCTKHFPDRAIPTKKKARHASIKKSIPSCSKTRTLRRLHEQFRTKIALGIELLEAAIRHKVPFGVVLFDSWYLAEELVTALARRHKDWISLLKKNRNLETNSFVLQGRRGQPDPVGWAAHRGGRPGPAHSRERVSPGDGRGQHLLVLYAGRAYSRVGQSAPGRSALRTRS